MPDMMLDPQTIARSVARAMADDPDQVGAFVEAIDMGDGVTDFRFATEYRGYEGWQWSVTLFHDEELDRWTVNESSLVPTDQALRPPEWVPWKDRLEPTDLSVTDSIGTDPDDPRLEEGFRRTGAVGEQAQPEDGADDAAAVPASDEGLRPRICRRLPMPSPGRGAILRLRRPRNPTWMMPWRSSTCPVGM